MEKYLLLRENKESGPYSSDELKALQLKASDLVREDSAGTVWQHPAEIDALKTIAASTTPSAALKKKAVVIAAFFTGVMICVSIAKMNSRLQEQSVAEKIRTLATLIKKQKTKGESFEHALVREAVPQAKAIKKTFSRPASPKEVFKQIKVQGNDYTVRYFGGISGLKLTVSNASMQFVNKAEVTVEYLNDKGHVIETDTYPVRALHPHSSQTVVVPPSMQGVKVRWKLLNICVYHKQLLKVI